MELNFNIYMLWNESIPTRLQVIQIHEKKKYMINITKVQYMNDSYMKI